MAVQESKKFLRIGVFRGKNCQEERVLKKRRTVSIGQEDTNTFCILSSAVPKKWNLFLYDSSKDTYTLCLKRGMTGRIVGKDKQSIVIDENLRAGGNVKIVDGDIHITLTNASRGRIVIGKINILFQFVSNHDEAAAARLLYEPPTFVDKFCELIPRALVYTFIFSLLAHVVPLVVIGVQDWPREDEFFLIPTHFKVVEIADMELEEEEEEEEEQPVVVEDSKEVLPEMDEAEAEEEPEPSTVTREELMDQITDKHREQGAMITAQILGVEGGVEGFFADILGSNAHIADMSDIAAGDIGASASGSLLNQLAASGGGAGGGLMGLDKGADSGPKVVVDSKAKTETKRAKVEFKMTDKSEFASAPPAGSKESIEKMFARKKNDISGCYQRVMNAQGKASGRFVVVISISKDGTVLKVAKVEDQIGGEMFTCVKQRIMNWKFGALKAPISFKKTWVFS